MARPDEVVRSCRPAEPDLPGPGRSGRPRRPRRARTVRPAGDVAVAVFVGGCAGGAARYAAASAWPTGPGGFAWSTLTVNVAGAFVLALVVVAAAQLVRSRLLRPLLGTGFCGALTTFSTVVVDVDRLVADGNAGTASAYLAANVLGGLAAAALGVVLARLLIGGRGRPALKGSA